MPKFEDLTNKKVGSFTVLRLLEQRDKWGHTLWECECICGIKTSIEGTYIRNGKAKVCECKKNKKIEEFINTRFGKLTVINLTNEKSKRGDKLWLCKCDCGNFIKIIKERLISGHTKTCGCSKTFLKDIEGKKFGLLTIIKKCENKDIHGCTIWEAICDCGNKITVRGSNLYKKTTKSCGCLKKNTANKIKNRTEAIKKNLYSSFKHSAKKRNLDCLLSFEDYSILINMPCTYCGVKNANNALDNSKYSNHMIKFNGIDRLNSSLGYTKENSVPCCWQCNVSKNTMTIEEFRQWITQVNNYYIKKENIIDENYKKMLENRIQFLKNNNKNKLNK